MGYWERYWNNELEKTLLPVFSEYFIIDSKKCDWCPFFKEKWPMSACVKSRCRNLSTEPKKEVKPFKKERALELYHKAKDALNGIKIPDKEDYTADEIKEIEEHKRVDPDIILPWEIKGDD